MTATMLATQERQPPRPSGDRRLQSTWDADSDFRESAGNFAIYAAVLDTLVSSAEQPSADDVGTSACHATALTLRRYQEEAAQTLAAMKQQLAAFRRHAAVYARAIRSEELAGPNLQCISSSTGDRSEEGKDTGDRIEDGRTVDELEGAEERREAELIKAELRKAELYKGCAGMLLRAHEAVCRAASEFLHEGVTQGLCAASAANVARASREKAFDDWRKDVKEVDDFRRKINIS